MDCGATILDFPARFGAFQERLACELREGRWCILVPGQGLAVETVPAIVVGVPSTVTAESANGIRRVVMAADVPVVHADDVDADEDTPLLLARGAS